MATVSFSNIKLLTGNDFSCQWYSKDRESPN